MKTKILLIATILVITLLLSSSCCVASQAIGVEISCDQFAENPHNIINHFHIGVGGKIIVKLCSNPSTGFQWDYETTIENVVEEEDHDFEELEGDVVGAPGIEVWTFRAIEKGTTEIQMEYSQLWEGGLKADWTYTITVTVE